MRRFLFAAPIMLLGACSMSERPFSEAGVNPGVYAPCAVHRACPSGEGYAVSTVASSFANGHSALWSHAAPSLTLRSQVPLGATYPSPAPQYAAPHYVAPQYIAPQQYAPQNFHGYGQSPQAHQLHQLRGMHTHNSGHFYGTLGGVIQNRELDVFGIEGRIGYDTGNVFGAELEGSLGVVNDNQTVQNPLIGDVEIDTGNTYNVAAFAMARIPVSKKLSMHGRVGYDFRRLTVDGKALDGTTVSQSGNFDGPAYGAGVEYALSPRSGLRFDLTRYSNDIGGNNSISGSFTRKF